MTSSVLQCIGTFVMEGEIITGAIHTLLIAAKVNMIPIERTSANAPDYRVLCGVVELGAGWKRTNAEGRAFVSVKLDDPALPNPIYASLCQDEATGGLSLLWGRPTRSQ